MDTKKQVGSEVHPCVAQHHVLQCSAKFNTFHIPIRQRLSSRWQSTASRHTGCAVSIHPSLAASEPLAQRNMYFQGNEIIKYTYILKSSSTRIKLKKQNQWPAEKKVQKQEWGIGAKQSMQMSPGSWRGIGNRVALLEWEERKGRTWRGSQKTKIHWNLGCMNSMADRIACF